MPEFGSYPEKESPAAGDFLLVLDGDDATTKKVDVGNLPSGGSFAASESRLWARAAEDADLDAPELYASWTFPDQYGVGFWGAFGDDLQLDPEDDTVVQVLTSGVYSVSVTSSIVGDVDLANMVVWADSQISPEIPFVKAANDPLRYTASYSWTGYISTELQDPYVQVRADVYTNAGTWTHEGTDLRIQRLA